MNDKLQNAGSEYRALVGRQIKQVTTAATDDFTAYMTKHGFEVKRSGNAVTARYQASEVVLQLPDPSEPPLLGAVARFQVRQTGQPAHVIVAMREGSGVSISTQVGPVKKPDELEKAKADLVEVEAQIKSYTSAKIIYRAQKEDDKAPILNAKAHDTFLEALQKVLD